MNDHTHDSQNQGSKLRDHTHLRHRAFWKHAHRNWRVWFVVMLMLAMMLVYVMTGDLSWRPGQRAGPPIPAANVP